MELTVAALGSTTALAHVHWEMSGVAKLPGWNVPGSHWGADAGVGESARAKHNTHVIEVPTLPKP